MFSRIISDPLGFILTLPCILLALSGHEFAHGWAAYRLGDPTAHNLGRLTLNPLKHLDPVGTLCMVFFGFGWARPVPINPRFFKNNKRDFALTALAGPLSNFIMALVGTLLLHILYLLSPNSAAAAGFGFRLWQAGVLMAQSFCILNISLGVFNLIPVPPLDGSRIFLVWLPAKYYFGVMQYERYIQLGLLLILWLGLLSRPLSWVVSHIFMGMDWLVSLIPFL